MPSILIDSQPYQVYADIADADTYAQGADHAATWRAITDDDSKARKLITATRILDRQSWGSDYETFDQRVAVEAIVSASIEIAIALADGSDLQNATTEQTQKLLKAGSVTLENFRASSASIARFPKIIQELLAPYLGSGSSSFASVAAGTGRLSISPLDLDFTDGL